jgi:hypothetical protein
MSWQKPKTQYALLIKQYYIISKIGNQNENMQLCINKQYMTKNKNHLLVSGPTQSLSLSCDQRDLVGLRAIERR